MADTHKAVFNTEHGFTFRLSLPAGSATDVCFSPSNNMLMVSVGMDAKIRCWDIQQRKYVNYEMI